MRCNNSNKIKSSQHWEKLEQEQWYKKPQDQFSIQAKGGCVLLFVVTEDKVIPSIPWTKQQKDSINHTAVDTICATKYKNELQR